MTQSSQEEVVQLIKRTNVASAELRDLLVSIISRAKNKEPETVECVYGLCAFIGDRSVALLLLAQEGYLWDAEILMRTVLEATMRILFLCLASEEERVVRLKEFREGLAVLNDLKHSERVKSALDALGYPEELVRSLGPIVLPDGKERDLRDRLPRKQRRDLEHKWGFFEMIADSEKYLQSQGVSGPLKSAMYGYGMSSHFLHGDHSALELVWDRRSRNEKERNALEVSHASRLCSDLLNYRILVGVVLCRTYKIDEGDIRQFRRDIQPLLNEFHAKDDVFWSTQIRSS